MKERGSGGRSKAPPPAHLHPRFASSADEIRSYLALASCGLERQQDGSLFRSLLLRLLSPALNWDAMRAGSV